MMRKRIEKPWATNTLATASTNRLRPPQPANNAKSLQVMTSD